MAIYETHCHLNHSKFDSDYDQVIDRSVQANVKRLLVVSYDLTSSRRALFLAQSYPQIFAAIGIHPEDADEWTELARDELVSTIRNYRDQIIAWGEIGLDYHWKTHEPALQKKVFIEQLTAAKSVDLPVIIHCREAYDDTIDVLEEFGASRVVLHCFTGTTQQALRAVSLGYYIGVGGVVTYKNAEDVRDVFKAAPLDRILLETDSPFLAPQEWRGKRNEPAYLSSVVNRLSELLNRPTEEIEDITWNNAVRLLG